MLTAAACQAGTKADTNSTTKAKELTVADTRGTCGAASLQHLIGETRDTVEGMTFDADRVRIIRPGMMVTMDLIESRLNILLDGNNRVTRVYCG